MQTSVCPSPDELKDYVRGKLDSQQSDLVSEHMLHCPACERTIVDIEAEPDTLVEILKCEVAVSAALGGNPNDRLAPPATASIDSKPENQPSYP